MSRICAQVWMCQIFGLCYFLELFFNTFEVNNIFEVFGIKPSQYTKVRSSQDSMQNSQSSNCEFIIKNYYPYPLENDQNECSMSQPYKINCVLALSYLNSGSTIDAILIEVTQTKFLSHDWFLGKSRNYNTESDSFRL